jgi:hypothetical protein
VKKNVVNKFYAMLIVSTATENIHQITFKEGAEFKNI